MKLYIKLIFSLLFLLTPFLVSPARAQADNLTLYLFHGEGCPHCAAEKEFLYNEIIPQYPNIEIKEYEVYKNRKNAQFLQKVGEELNVRVDGVPFLVIGDAPIVGYASGITSREITDRVEVCSAAPCPDSIAKIAADYPADGQSKEIVNNKKADKEKEVNENNNNLPEKMINLPIFGEVDAMSFSLPILTIILGALDGFNPCAMWVLLFLISLLLGMRDRRKMWLLGTAFIIASAFVYFLFMAAWLNLIIFLGFIVWVRILIGIVALFGGGYSLREFFVNKDSGCKVVGAEKKRKTFDRMKEVVHQNSLWLALGGIILLAFAVNLVELICSAGLPAIYTQVLALNDMATWKYYLYILGYIFFFMLDDLIIFFIAMTTLRVTGITTKYTRVSRLIGGLLMLIIGLLMIFKPELLMFG
jgi:glutaredoxin